jgi:hypothetical protein
MPLLPLSCSGVSLTMRKGYNGEACVPPWRDARSRYWGMSKAHLVPFFPYGNGAATDGRC